MSIIEKYEKHFDYHTAVIKFFFDVFNESPLINSLENSEVKFVLTPYGPFCFNVSVVFVNHSLFHISRTPTQTFDTWDQVKAYIDSFYSINGIDYLYLCKAYNNDNHHLVWDETDPDYYGLLLYNYFYYRGFAETEFPNVDFFEAFYETFYLYAKNFPEKSFGADTSLIDEIVNQLDEEIPDPREDESISDPFISKEEALAEQAESDVYQLYVKKYSDFQAIPGYQMKFFNELTYHIPNGFDIDIYATNELWRMSSFYNMRFIAIYETIHAFQNILQWFPLGDQWADTFSGRFLWPCVPFVAYGQNENPLLKECVPLVNVSPPFLVGVEFVKILSQNTFWSITGNVFEMSKVWLEENPYFLDWWNALKPSSYSPQQLEDKTSRLLK